MSSGDDGDSAPHAIAVHLDRLLKENELTLTELSLRVGLTLANLSILKNGRARAIRFSTLTALCRELHCQPGDLLSCQDTDSGPPRKREGQLR